MIQRVLFPFALAIILVTGAVLGRDLVVGVWNPGQIRGTILGLGPWAPVGLIALSAIQIVLAPIPGSLMQVAGGYIFGPILGSIYGVVGTLTGASISFLLTRRFGVPLLARLVPVRLLDSWTRLRKVDSIGVWILAWCCCCLSAISSTIWPV